jgi:hypothetical protein
MEEKKEFIKAVLLSLVVVIIFFIVAAMENAEKMSY